MYCDSSCFSFMRLLLLFQKVWLCTSEGYEEMKCTGQHYRPLLADLCLAFPIDCIWTSSISQFTHPIAQVPSYWESQHTRCVVVLQLFGLSHILKCLDVSRYRALCSNYFCQPQRCYNDGHRKRGQYKSCSLPFIYAVYQKKANKGFRQSPCQHFKHLIYSNLKSNLL